MIRRKSKTVDAIICSDLHLRETTPHARKDNYFEAQTKKLNFISELQKKYRCPVLCAGDIFDHWKPSPFLISYALEYLPDRVIAIPGQHDLPQHNLSLFEKSGLFTLAKSGKLKVSEKDIFYPGLDIYAVPFGLEAKNDLFSYRILVMHQLTWKKALPFPGAPKEGEAIKLLKKYAQADLIITGDNHIPFTEEYRGRLLVNPGSMMRMTSAQIKHRPRAYLWSSKTNTAEPVYLPIEEGVWEDHQATEQKKQRQDRIQAFIGKLGSDFQIEYNFEGNLNRYLQENKVPTTIKQIILEAIGE